jgi:YfiH family protein
MHATAPPALRLVPRAGVRAAFTGRRHGNVSLLVGDGDAAPARRGLGELVGLTPERTVFMEQVHGSAVGRVGADDAGRGVARHADAIAGVDALVTDEPDLALVVLTADCVPLLLVGERAVGAAHAGRRGLVDGVVEAAVAALCDLGERPEDLVALIGPSVGACCYELPEDEADAAVAVMPQLRGRTTWGSPSLDLVAGADAVLRRAGVGRRAAVRACTRCGAADWFSHRAATDGREPRAEPGRQASVVARSATEPGSGAQGLPSGLHWLA